MLVSKAEIIGSITRAPAGTLCIRTLIEHSGRVFRLQFDEFQIVSSRYCTISKLISYQFSHLIMNNLATTTLY